MRVRGKYARARSPAYLRVCNTANNKLSTILGPRPGYPVRALGIKEKKASPSPSLFFFFSPPKKTKKLPARTADRSSMRYLHRLLKCDCLPRTRLHRSNNCDSTVTVPYPPKFNITKIPPERAVPTGRSEIPKKTNATNNRSTSCTSFFIFFPLLHLSTHTLSTDTNNKHQQVRSSGRNGCRRLLSSPPPHSFSFAIETNDLTLRRLFSFSRPLPPRIKEKRDLLISIRSSSCAAATKQTKSCAPSRRSPCS